MAVEEGTLLQENQELKAENQRLKQELGEVQFQLAELKRMVFGQKRERFVSEENPAQGELFAQIPESENPAEPEQEKISYERKKNKGQQEKPKHPGRHAFPDHLPRNQVILEPKEVKEGWVKIGEEVSEQLEYQAAKLFVNRFVRPKYAETEELNTQVHIAEPAHQPLPKAAAGPGLLAAVAVDKYCDHLPLYRQGQRFSRQDVPIPDSTLGQWMMSLAGLLTPLYEALEAKVLQDNKYLQIDETPIKVQDPAKKGKTHQGYYWTVNSPEQQMVFFRYTKSRSGQFLRELLEGWQGTVQSDGYQGYRQLPQGATSAFCWAHARRYFEHALDNDRKRAESVLEKIQALYKIEERARSQGLSPPERQVLREQEAVLLLEELEKMLKELGQQVLPKSAIGKAVRYALQHWEGLAAYSKNGRLEIDNNLAENTIRPLALGRKNYLFAGSHNGAEKAAVFYSLLGTAKMQGLNPLEWLTGVLKKISVYDKPSTWNMEELLPLK